MSYAQRVTVTVTTDSGGAATAYSDTVTGLLSQIRYVKSDYSAGVDFTITAEATGETLWTQLNVDASVTVAPRQATHDTAGLASLFASGGEPVEDKIALAADRIKIVIANGGSTHAGVFHFLII